MIRLIFILFIACLTSCTLRPLCLTKNIECGCDKSKIIHLSQKTNQKLIIDWDKNYLFLLEKRKSVRKLARFTSDKSGKAIFSGLTSFDTLNIDVTNANFSKFNRFVVRQIHFHKVVIIDKQTGAKLKFISRRKYNLHCKTSRTGAGGKEYSDPDKKYVIVRKRFWIS